MKTKLLLPAALFLLFSINLFSQNTWIGGGTDTNWSNKDNWSADAVPLPSDDVLIPTGFNVNADSVINVQSITVEGNSTLNVQSGMTFRQPSVFRQNTTINYFNGLINGHGSILTSEGTINIMTSNLADVSNSTTINNLGTINCVSGFLFINTDSVINNSGTIDFKTNGFELSRAGAPPYALINTGLIKTSFLSSSDEAFIACQVINTGTIQVETGTLNLNNSAVNLAGGLYHVAAGATLNLNSPTTISGILTGNVFGDLNWNDDFIVPTTAFFNFEGNNIINCTGNLIGGGTLTNQTTINQIGGAAMQIDGATTLDNDGLIEITSGPGISIGTNSVLNNNASGVIDLKVDGANIISLAGLGGVPNMLNNSGLIKTSFPNPTDQSIFSTQLNNNNGTIEVNSGTLWLSNSNTTLTNGIYNIASGATLLWTLPITISGTLNGTLNGTFDWKGDLLVPSSAIFNFTGDGTIEWSTKSLNGGGTLTNEHNITIVSGSNKTIEEGTTLLNNAEIISSAGFVRIGTNSTLNNALSGTIDIETEAINSSFGTVNSPPHSFINYGTLIASSSLPAYKTLISAPINNFGIIEATSTEIEFSNMLINETSGVIKGGGIIDLPTAGNFTNNGTFAPGNSPGSLTIVGDYSTTASSQLGIELNGLTQGIDYDVLNIQGNASFEGDIQITLGFEAAINDEFIIGTTTGTIGPCSLPVSKTADYNGNLYEFSIACRNNDKVVLTVTNKTLGIDDIEKELSSVKLYPNPTKDIATFSDHRITKIEVFDINGRRLLSINGYTISVKHLSKGIYLIKGTTAANKTIVKRLIKD